MWIFSNSSCDAMSLCLWFHSQTIYIVDLRHANAWWMSDDDNDLEKALSEVFTPSECMICFEDIVRIGELCICKNCKKEWCRSCDISWRVTRMSASLLPTCPFCRKRLESLVVLEEETRSATRESVIIEQQLFNRLMMSLIKWISYVMLAMVLLYSQW